jgi:hypothetical protein
VHLLVDLVLAGPPDRDLELVAGGREVQATADPDERPCELERQVALEPGRLDLRLLAQPLGLQEGGQDQPEDEHQDAATGRSGEEAHQKRK